MKTIYIKLLKTLGAIGAIGIATSATAQAEYASTTHYVNMRSGPSVHFPAIKVIPRGAAIKVNKCYRYWCNVKYGPFLGWTNVNFIHFLHDKPQIIEIHEREQVLPDFYFVEPHNHYYYHHHYYRRHDDIPLPPPPPPMPLPPDAERTHPEPIAYGDKDGSTGPALPPTTPSLPSTDQ